MQNYSENLSFKEPIASSSNFEHLFQRTVRKLQPQSHQQNERNSKVLKSTVCKKLFTDAITEKKKISLPQEDLLCEDCYSRNQWVQTSGILSHPTEFWVKNLQLKCDGSCVRNQENPFLSSDSNIQTNWEEWQRIWFQVYRPWVDVDDRTAYAVGTQVNQCFCENC